MLYAIIILFAITAIMGVVILKNWLTSANTPKTIIYLHGVFAAVALVLLLVEGLRNTTNTIIASIVFFVIAAIGGFYMFFQDLKGKYSPVWLAVTHGLLAVVSFVLLLLIVI